MARQTIYQRIALQGGEEIRKELAQFGSAGEKAFQELQAAINKTKSSFDQLLANLAKVQRSLIATGKTFKEVGSSIRNVGRDFRNYVTLPILATGAAVLKAAGDFEAGVNEFVANAGVTGQALDAAKQKALELGQASVFSSSEAIGAMTELVKVGRTYEEVMTGAADATVALAAANGAELAPAAAVIGDVMNQFGLDATKLKSVVDSITGTLLESKLDFDGYRLALGQAGGAAGALGVKLEDFNAVLAVTASSFASGSDAGTSFKQFLVNLVPTSKEAAKVFKELDLQFFDSQGNMRSMGEIADELKKKLGKLSQEDLNKKVKTIFGTDAMRTAIALMRSGGKAIEDMKVTLDNTDATALAEVRMQGFNGAVKQLLGSLENLAIAIGDSGLLEFMTDLVDKLTVLVQEMAKASPETLRFGVVMAGIAAAIGPALIALGLFVSGLGFIVSGVGRAVGSIGLLLRALAALRAFTLANPWIAAITLIATGILLWATRTDEATAAMEHHREVVDEAAAAYAKVGGEVEKISKSVRDRLFLEQSEQFGKDSKALQDAVQEARESVEQWVDQLPHEADQINELMRQFANGSLDIGKFQAAVDALAKSDPKLFGTLANQLADITKAPLQLTKNIQEAQNWLDLLGGKITDTEFKARQAAAGFGDFGATAIKETGKQTDTTKAKVEQLNEAVKTITVHSGGKVQTFEVLQSGVAAAQKSVDGLTSSSEDSADAIDGIGESADAAVVKVTRLNIATEAEQKKSRTKKDATADDSIPDINKIETQAVEVKRVVDTTVDDAKAKLNELSQIPAPADALTKGLPEADAALQATVQNVTAAASGSQTAVDALGQSLTDAGTSAQTALVEVPTAAKTAIDGLIAELSRVQPIVAAISESFKTIFGTVQTDEEKEAATAALVSPFASARDQIGTIWDQIRNFAVSGINAVLSEVGRLTAQINQMISSIIAALQRAAAAAARLRAQAAADRSAAAGTDRFATGVVRLHGPGTGTSDSILAQLSKGESVITAKATDHWHELLRAINAGLKPEELPRWLSRLKGFSMGRVVDGIKGGFDGLTIPQFAMGAVALTPASGGGPAISRTPVHLHMPNGEEIIGLFKPEDVAKKMMKYTTQRAIRSTGRKPGWKG